MIPLCTSLSISTVLSWIYSKSGILLFILSSPKNHARGRPLASRLLFRRILWLHRPFLIPTRLQLENHLQGSVPLHH